MKKLSDYIKNNIDRNYTLNDIIVKNYEIWAVIPPVMFCLSVIAEFIVFSFIVAEHPVAGENIYYAIILLFSIISIIPTMLGISGFILKRRYSDNKNGRLFGITSVFFSALCVLEVVSTLCGNYESGIEPVIQSLFLGVCNLCIYYFNSQLIESKKYKIIIVNLILFVSVFAGLIELIDLFIRHIPSIIYTGVTSVFCNSNHYGYFLTITIALSAAMALLSEKSKNKLIYFLIFVFNTVMLNLTHTFGSFLGVSVALLFMIITVSVKKERFSWEAVIMVLSFLLISWFIGLKYSSFFTDFGILKKDISSVIQNTAEQNSAGSGRWKLWKRTLELINEKPLLGWGTEGISNQLSDIFPGVFKPHNEYLETAVYFGIPAAVFYIAGLISVFIKALINKKTIDYVSTACLVSSLAYIGSAFFGNVKFYTAPFFFIVLGLASRYNIDKQDNDFHNKNCCESRNTESESDCSA